jgi:hypothetical protein
MRFRWLAKTSAGFQISKESLEAMEVISETVLILDSSRIQWQYVMAAWCNGNLASFGKTGV